MNSSTSIQMPPTTRSCGDCAMCCKIPLIPELEKPAMSWCQHCSTRASCDIHPTRPQRCRDYQCYFTMSDLGEEWRPNKARFMISTFPGKLLLLVDPSRPDSWRKEPYFNTLKHWSTQVEVHVLVNNITYIIFPTHIDDLGEVTDDHQIAIYQEQTPNGIHRRAARILRSEIPAGAQLGVPYSLKP
ncbi:MAG: hypothetical protein ACOYNL_03640 [Rickettsiales bacterium]